MINWLLQQIEEANDRAEHFAQEELMEASNYQFGRRDALKECLKFIEDASRKEKENE